VKGALDFADDQKHSEGDMRHAKPVCGVRYGQLRIRFGKICQYCIHDDERDEVAKGVDADGVVD